MILYHFTDKESAKAIKEQGLTKGMLNLGPFGKEIKLIKNYQWLCDRPILGKDSMLEKRYRDVMIIISIPDGDKNLMSPRTWKKSIRSQVAPGWWNTYTQPESNHWWVYKGIIPPDWIVNVKIKGAENE